MAEAISVRNPNRLGAGSIQLALVVLWSYLAISESISLKHICILSFFNTLIVFWTMARTRKVLFSLSAIFMMFLALFHFGQAWIYAVGSKVDKNISYDLFSLYTEDDLSNVLIFSLLAYNLVAFFLIVFAPKVVSIGGRDIDYQRNDFFPDRKLVYKFGIVLFGILLIPVAIFDYLSISYASQAGYGGIYANADKLARWALFNSYFPLAIILLLLGCDPRKNGWKPIFYFAVLHSLALMVLTGHRGPHLIPVLLFFFCKHYFIKPYKAKHVVLMGCFGFILLMLLSFVSYGRHKGYANLDLIEFMREKNVFIQTFSEFGCTLVTTILAYKYTITHAFLEGKSYLGSLAVFIPFSTSLTPELKPYISISALLNPYSPSKGALGGSFFAEMYINFGYYSLMLTPVFGWIICKLENITRRPDKYSLFAICCIIYIAFGLWIYARGNLYDLVTAIKRALYVFILFWLCKKTVFNHKHK